MPPGYSGGHVIYSQRLSVHGNLFPVKKVLFGVNELYGDMVKIK
jgi:hypothetical protein